MLADALSIPPHSAYKYQAAKNTAGVPERVRILNVAPVYLPLVQRLKSNAVTDLTPRICNQHPSEEIQNSQRKKLKTNSLHALTSKPPGLQTNVIKVK
ncbi:hypothetical protein J6590_104009 [Homalodisca vitripennis]|nr:hypothetical protein J6590_103786 [Homalodisca vitripennis]KAG8290197.1 hypothetical protein J6590_088115 [Homalodisca vitripennis]KAG8290198.1 hypothetical protein J6590_088116 [Homalodisca vitripennis]KAG8299314.1 hypothetical protein J6590_104009 [Homalodisca vitripennis]